MKTRLTVVDAFTDQPYRGNPAAVCLLSENRTAEWMQHVALEMNLSETCFLRWEGEATYHLRWFTPTTEVPLCGHATLASAHLLWAEGEVSPEAGIIFRTAGGVLHCAQENGWIRMMFPRLQPEPTPDSWELAEALGAPIEELASDGRYLLARLADATQVRRLQPQFSHFLERKMPPVAVTARSDDPAFDFISRFFAPTAGIAEDPVTGSAHCLLGPYWMDRIGKSRMMAYQASARGGVVDVEVMKEQVVLRGQAVSMSRVEWLH